MSFEGMQRGVFKQERKRLISGYQVGLMFFNDKNLRWCNAQWSPVQGGVTSTEYYLGKYFLFITAHPKVFKPSFIIAIHQHQL